MRSATHHKHRTFIYVFNPVRPELATNPNAWSEEDERIAEAHYAHPKQATEMRGVLLAGRSLDGVGPAIVIFEADSEAEARKLMENDPFELYPYIYEHASPASPHVSQQVS